MFQRICLAVYLQYQTVYPVCIRQLTCYFVRVSEWCHSGAVCQGRKPRCHQLVFPITGHLPVWILWGCMYMCMQKTHSLSISTGMHLVKGCRYLMLRCRSSCTVWPVALLWLNCEVFLISKPWDWTVVTDGPHFPFLDLCLSVLLHCDDGCPALCKYSPAPAS